MPEYTEQLELKHIIPVCSYLVWMIILKVDVVRHTTIATNKSSLYNFIKL